MRRVALGLAAGAVGIGVLAALEWVVPPAPEAARVPVLVELFTSEGCASCPPADALLIELDADDQFVPGALVIPLSEHVDYWNGSWRDPHSSEAYTERQRSYHPRLGDRALYTPEMVVDGRAQFVGSQRLLAEHAIHRAVASPKASVDLSVSRSADDASLGVALTVAGMSALGITEDLDLVVAVTETGLETDVLQGENAARRLAHGPVVRWMQSLATLPYPVHDTYATTIAVPLQPDWRRRNLRVVAFVQERRSRHVRGAAEVRARHEQGYELSPTVVVGEEHLTNPSVRQVREAMARR